MLRAMSEPRLPDLTDLRAAAGRIADAAHRTPVLTSRALDERVDARVHLKCECFQRAGAFKLRGALNAVRSLPAAEAARGVVTHSSGNHAGALALAARLQGVPAHIVMPSSSSPVKLAAVREYGARVLLCEPTLAAREETAARVLAETGGVLIHPYDDPRVIAGAGTAALELLEQAGELDLVLAPVGGGGLMSGTCIAVASVSPRTRLVGVEPTGADDARRSLEAGRVIPSVSPRTIADGLLTSLSERTFTALQRHLERIVTVDDDAIVRAMRFVWERMKIVIEPSSAVPVAALLERAVEARGLRVGVILSGGNVAFSGDAEICP